MTAGRAAGSIALVSFGLDSAIAVFAALIVIGQLHGRTSYIAALRLIGASFFVPAACVSVKASLDSSGEDKAEDSWVGLAVNIRALSVMVPVPIARQRTGRGLGNEVLVAQSREAWISNYLAVSLLAGLGANALFGWWWADPVAALVISAVAVREGWESWRESTG